jgi:hypothetical protein
MIAAAAAAKRFVLVSALLAAANVAQCDGADVRALLRQQLTQLTMALPQGASCEQQVTEPLHAMCKQPAAGYIVSQQGGCTAAQFPIYVYVDEGSFAGNYVQQCGSATCKFADTVKAEANVGGKSCTGNKNVDVSAPAVMLGADCLPCQDDLFTAPQDPLNLAACGLTNYVFGCAVKWTVKAAKVVEDFSTDLATDIASGATNLWSMTGQAFDTVGNGIVDMGNDVANGGKKAVKSTKKALKKIG